MAKTTVTKDVLKIVDLVRNKPKLTYLEIPKYRADVHIEVTTTATLTKPKPIPSTAMARLKDAAEAVLLEYETVIRDEAIRIDGKVAELMKQPSKSAQSEAEDLASAAQAMITKALEAAEPQPRPRSRNGLRRRRRRTACCWKRGSRLR